MKKIILTFVALLIAITTIQVQAQKTTPAQKRKIERAIADSINQVNVRWAVENKDLYFDGIDMQIKNLDRYSLRAPYNMVEVDGDFIRVRLPYFTSVNLMGNNPAILDFESSNIKYSYTERNGVYIVKIDIREAKNTAMSTRRSPSDGYTLTLTISGSGNSSVDLALTPNFTSTIFYRGRLDF
ncbi:MAG: DUF4251 domain-containing protein [Mucinivorans sp.]